ncbi:MAG: hypothetical protein AB1414_02560 [bacterium]
MVDKKVDGRQASELVRDYFDNVHGNFMVCDFRIKKTEFDSKTKHWIVNCSFLPHMSARERIEYEVEVNAQEPMIERVTLLDEVTGDKEKIIEELEHRLRVAG